MHAKLPFFLDPWDFPVCALFAFQRHQFRFNPLLAVNKMPTGFRSNIFDPFLIIAKIVSLFCFHCACLGGWLVLANFIGGTHSTIDQLFDYQEFEGTYDGWLVMGAVSLNSFTTALIMWKIVRRAKQCLDFTVTVGLIYFVVCVCYNGIPHSWAWWLTHLVSMAITAITSEYLCMRSELAAIPLSAGSLART